MIPINQIKVINDKIDILDIEEKTNREVQQSVELLRQIIAKEIDFNDGLDSGIISSLLDKIQVFKTDKKNVIDVKVFLKVLKDEFPYSINRGRSSTSVCTKQYI